MASGVYAIPQIEFHGRGVLTNTTPVDDLPRRRAARGVAVPRARDRPVRRRDRDGSRSRCGGGTSSRRTRSRTRRRPAPPTTPATTRARSTSRSARSATRSCAQSSSGAARRATRCELGIGISRLRRDHEPGQRGRVRRGGDHARTASAIVRTGLVLARPGPRDDVRDDRRRRLGLPIEKIDGRQGRHRRGRRRARAPTGRSRRRSAAQRRERAADDVVEQAKELVADLLEAASTTSCSTPPAARFHVVGSPEPSLTWADLAARAADAASSTS